MSMKLSVAIRFTVILFLSGWIRNAFPENSEPDSLVIIETISPNQKGDFDRTYCLGFMLSEYDLITAYRCAAAAPENLRVYRSAKDCNAHKKSIPVAITAQRNTPDEPTTVGLSQAVNDNMVAITRFPYMDVDEPLYCYFLTTFDNKLSINTREVNYYDAAVGGLFKIITSKPSSFSGKPIPGAILVNSEKAVIGVSFENNQIYSPMHGFIVPFHTVALDDRTEL